MIKQIVVAVDGSEDSMIAVENALFLAEKRKSDIKFVYVIDIRKITLPTMYTMPSYSLSADTSYIPFDQEIQSMYSKLELDYKDFGMKILKQTEEKASAKGIKSTSLLLKGIPSEIICSEAKTGDILVIGKHGENSAFKGVITGSVTENVVRKSPRPVLVCPKKISRYKNAFFSYNKNISTENALGFLADNFGNITKDVVFFCSEKDYTSTEGNIKEKEFIENHKLKVSVMVSSFVTASTVLEQVEATTSDFIVMGAHSNKTLREYILGSLSATVLRKSNIPVLIAY